MFFVIWVILFSSCCLSASPIHEALPTNVHKFHSNLKREYIFECGDYNAHFGEFNTPGFHISSLQELCLNYPQGLGAFCSGPSINFREPRNPLYFQPWQGGGGISSLCRRLCRCHNIAPDTPSIQNEPAFKGKAACSDNEEDTSDSSRDNSAPQTTEMSQCFDYEDTDSITTYENRLACDATFYGHPDSTDCEAAIRELPDWGEATHAIREYFEATDSSNNHDSYFAQEIEFDGQHMFSFRDKVKSPVIIARGACKVAVLLPQEPGHPPQPAMVGSQALINAAEDLRMECVSRLGSGGKFDHLWFLNYRVLIPNIFMFERDSLMDDWLTLKTAESITNSDSSRQTACSGSCMDPHDCDINSDCVCASDKPIPLSSTWGQHACTYVAGAALAHMQATVIKPYSRCRGRCISEDGENSNRTVQANVTSHAVTSSHQSFINRTRPLTVTTSPPNILSNHTRTTPSHPNNSTHLSNRTSAAFHPPISESNNSINYPAVPLFKSLTCPCNCTYVSTACCLSPLVWEDPAKQVKMNPLPANGTLCCNATSGEWLPKRSPGLDCAALN